MESSTAIRHFEGDSFSIFSGEVVFSSDSKLALVGAGDAFGGTGEKNIVLWDIETGVELRRFSGYTASVLDGVLPPMPRLPFSFRLMAHSSNGK